MRASACRLAIPSRWEAAPAVFWLLIWSLIYVSKKNGPMANVPLAPRPAAVTTGRDLATRTPTSEVPMTDSAHSMNLLGARLGVKLCPNLIAVRPLP
jgi:hypothetical protein